MSVLNYDHHIPWRYISLALLCVFIVHTIFFSIQDVVNNMTEGQVKGFLIQMIQEQPGLIIDLMEMEATQPPAPASDTEQPSLPGGESLDIPSSPGGEPPSPEEPPAPPSPGPQAGPPPAPQPHWCRCGNCRRMAIGVEEVCCRMRPSLKGTHQVLGLVFVRKTISRWGMQGIPVLSWDFPTLAVSARAMLIANVDVSDGLCNGMNSWWNDIFQSG